MVGKLLRCSVRLRLPFDFAQDKLLSLTESPIGVWNEIKVILSADEG